MPSSGITRIGQIAVVVRDLDAAVEFYRDVLGLPFLFQAPPGMAFFDCGGVRLMLTLPEKGEPERTPSILYYAVDDIHGAARLLEERGAALERAPELIARQPRAELWMAFFRDMDHNLFALMSESSSS